MQMVLFPTNSSLASAYAFELEHRYEAAMQRQADGVLHLSREGLESRYFVNEVYRRSIFQIYDCVGGERGSDLLSNSLDYHVPTSGQIDPKVHVESRSHHALRNGSGHPDQDELDAFLLKGRQ